MKNVEDFDKAIEKLDGLILRGFSITLSARNEFTKTNKAEGNTELKGEELIKKHRRQYHKWYDDVDRSITELTDRKYYLVHLGTAAGQGNIMIEGLSMAQSGFIVAVEARIAALYEILTMLEERRSVVIRQEIAKQEYDSSHRYWLSYDEIAGKLYLNGNILIASTRLDSPADKLLQQVFASPNNLIELKQITSTQVSSALRDLNITGALKKIFFPRTSGSKVLFRPFITNTEFVNEELKEISLADMRNDEN